MAGYTNSNLNDIYNYLGFNHYVLFDPEIKAMIISTQAVVDGGSQPDGSLQAKVLGIVSTLQSQIDANLSILSPMFFASKSSSGAVVDMARADWMLRRQGRALIQQLCIIMGIKGVRQDYYARGKKVGYEDGGMSYVPGDNI